jgi:hypothetical protein
MTDPVVHIQVDPTDSPSTPSWFGEVAVVAHALQRYGVLDAIQERVRFVRARMGKYELIDFVAMLIGYAVSGEPTLRAFCERVQPFASAFMALFGRADFPTPPTLSRYLAVLDQPCVEALRTLFLEDLLARAPFGTPPGGLWDRLGGQWLLMDVDGTKQAARQRALPATPDLPPAHRRFDRVCAPGHLGRKRGEVARTRTTILQAHTHQWVGTFGNPGNGQYRQELKLARAVITTYARTLSFPLSHVVIRLDGLYGDAAPLADLLATGAEKGAEGPAVVVRGKAYHLLEQPVIQQRLKLPPDQVTVHPESGTSRALYDCGPIQLAPAGPLMRMLVATHPAGSKLSSIGKVREGTVYEQFFTTLPSSAFTPADVLDLYLHRGSFETVLADEDEEQAVDRWVSRTQWGQEFWQIMSQWIWNLRLELGQHAQATTMRVTDLAYSQVQEPPTPPPDDDPPPDGTPPPIPPGAGPPSADTAPVDPAAPPPVPAAPGEAETSQNALDWPASYGPPNWARPSFTHGFPGPAFTPQPDGTLRCPAGHPLFVQERRPERNGSLRVLYAARIGHCRPCPLRNQCQESDTTLKPRRVSAVFWPRAAPPVTSPPACAAPVSDAQPTVPPIGAAPAASVPPPAVPAQPVRWGDWPRCRIRQEWVQLLRTQTVLISSRATATLVHAKPHSPPLETRAERAHWRLSWEQRLARNARPPTAPSVEIVLYGLPASFIQAFGFPRRPAA